MSTIDTHNYGMHGGLNPKPMTSEDQERLEPNRKRTPDYISETIREFASLALGPHIIHKTFTIDVPLTRGMEITFDRYYPFEKLLVHSFSRRRTYEVPIDLVFEADLLRYESFARDHGFKFLPIIDGEIEVEDLKRIKVQLAPPKQTPPKKVAAHTEE
jgi:hypothetical protein